MRAWPPELDQLIRDQYGLVTRQQLLAWGIPASTISRWVRDGRLLPIVRGVYRLAGAPTSWSQWARAACLSAGEPVVVSHLAAAFLFELPSVAKPAMELTIPPSRVARVHRTRVHRRMLPEIDRDGREGIPVTTPARLVIDLCGTISDLLLARVLDDLLRARQVTIDVIDRRLEAAVGLPRFDRPFLEELLARRRGQRPGASPREDWVLDVLLRANLPVPVRGHLIEIEGELREIDLAYPLERVAIEYDGWSTHHEVNRFHRDRSKFLGLELLGWVVVPITSDWSGTDVVRRVSRALDLQRRRYGLSA